MTTDDDRQQNPEPAQADHELRGRRPHRLLRLRRPPTTTIPARQPAPWPVAATWCQPDEQIYTRSPCTAWSTRSEPRQGGPTWLDHGDGTLYITNLQTVVFLSAPGDVLCVPHWTVTETGIRHGHLEIAMIGHSIVRLHLPDAHTHQHLLDHLREGQRRTRSRPFL